MFRQLAQFTTRGFALRAQFGFARLKQGGTKRDLNRYENALDYYQEVLRFSKVSETGILKDLHSSDLFDMMRLSKSSADVELLVSSFYNFLGHRVHFTQQQIDEFVLFCLKLEGAPQVRDIFHYHNSLMYFPHPRVVDAYTAQVVQRANAEEVLALAKTLASRKLLRVLPETVANVLAFAREAANDEIAFYCLWVSHQHAFALSAEQKSLYLQSLQKAKVTAANGVLEREQELLSYLEGNRSAVGAAALVQEAQVFLTAGNLELALSKLMDLTVIDKKTLAALKPVLAWDEATKNLFEGILQALETQARRKLYKRYLQTLNFVQSELGKDHIHPEVHAITEKVYNNLEKMNSLYNQQSSDKKEQDQAQ